MTTSAGLIVVPRMAHGEQPGKIRRIALLLPGSREKNAHLIRAFEARIGELGYAPVKDVIVIARFADGQAERLPNLADELVRSNVDVIVVASNPPPHSLLRPSSRRSRGSGSCGGARRKGTSECIASFHQGLREAGYVEGRDVVIEQRWAADVVQRLNPLAAELVRVGVSIIVTQGGAPLGLEETEIAARALRIHLDVLPVRSADEFASALGAARTARVDFVVVLPSPILSFHWKLLVDLASKHRLPTVFGQRSPVEAGGLPVSAR